MLRTYALDTYAQVIASQVPFCVPLSVLDFSAPVGGDGKKVGVQCLGRTWNEVIHGKQPGVTACV